MINFIKFAILSIVFVVIPVFVLLMYVVGIPLELLIKGFIYLCLGSFVLSVAVYLLVILSLFIYGYIKYKPNNIEKNETLKSKIPESSRSKNNYAKDGFDV